MARRWRIESPPRPKRPELKRGCAISPKLAIRSPSRKTRHGYVRRVKADIDLEALGLLDGLEGDARQERVELIRWLLDRGFSIDQILASGAAMMLLPANRLMGDDGIYVSAREGCEATGIGRGGLQRLER